MSLLKRGLGRLADLFDERDHLFSETAHPALREAGIRLHESDLRENFPECWDQGQANSCEGHAGAGLLAFYAPGFMPSRLAIYYSGRSMEGGAVMDSGMYTRDLMKVLMNGVYAEELWPYDLMKINDMPPEIEGDKVRIGSYSRLKTADDYLACLSAGHPFVLSFNVPYTFDDFVARTGIIPRNRPNHFLGGHAVVACGHSTNFRSHPDFLASGLSPDQVDDTMLLIRNSWGTSFGFNGYFWMPITWAADNSLGNDAWAAHPSSEGLPTAGGVPIHGHFV